MYGNSTTRQNSLRLFTVRLKQHPDCKKAWSWDGQLFAELKTGAVIKVPWAESLEAATERYAARKWTCVCV